MVQALLDGRKTMTRRVVKQAVDHGEIAGEIHPARLSGFVAWFPGKGSKMLAEMSKTYDHGFLCPHGEPGDLLWVRETFAFDNYLGGPVAYKATDELPPFIKWKPSIHMPRWASRLTLRVTNVRVERVQEISEYDAIYEGVDVPTCPGCGYTYWDCLLLGDHSLCPKPSPEKAVPYFRSLWDSINAKRGYGWEANPWVWVISFEVIQQNVDEVAS
jgi:hypothetical protein